MEATPESIRIIQKLIKLIQADLAKSKKVGLKQEKSKEIRNILNSIPNKDEQSLIVLDHTIAALENVLRSEPSVDTVKCDQSYENWMDLVMHYLKDFNKYGNCYINSCGEALLKTFGIKSFMNKGSNLQPIYFRGEHIFGWDLTPRVVRKLNLKYNPDRPFEVTKEELKYLKDFQKKYFGSRLKWIFKSTEYKTSANWWATMAHYDDEVGTRMIDITSSIFCALYFSCVDWDGSINTDEDGCLYFLWNNNWRKDSEFPDIRNGQIIGPEDQKEYTIKKYFSVQDYLGTIRFRESPHSNERLIYQDGFFLWQPSFSDPIDLGQHHKFRVHKNSKKEILRELYSIGYTAKRIVRGEIGNEAHLNICDQLDIIP